MKEFDFILKFQLHDAQTDPEKFVDILYSSGCDDALIGIGQKGRIALNFNRAAESALVAIKSAISDVKKGIPNAVLIEAGPDYVGLTDIAEILDFSRQNMRKIMVKNQCDFPTPVHEGSSSIWHLHTILQWLVEKKGYQVDEALLQVSKETMRFNFAIEAKELEPSLDIDIRLMVSRSNYNITVTPKPFDIRLLLNLLKHFWEDALVFKTNGNIYDLSKAQALELFLDKRFFVCRNRESVSQYLENLHWDTDNAVSVMIFNDSIELAYEGKNENTKGELENKFQELQTNMQINSRSVPMSQLIREVAACST